MRNSFKLASAVLGGLLLVGCDSKDNSTTTTPPAAADAKPSVVDQAKTAAGDAEKKVGDAVDAAKDKVKDAASSATDTSAAQADLSKVMDAIKEKKWDVADAALTKVEANKASLPSTIQNQLPALRTQVDAGKAAGSLKMPGMGN